MTTRNLSADDSSVRPSEAVVLLTDADCDNGCRCARELLAKGFRVVVTARHPSRFTPFLLGQDPDRVMAIAADLSDPSHGHNCWSAPVVGSAT